MESLTIRCPHCQLNQFMTVSGACRKCRAALNVPKFEKPQPKPTLALVKPKVVAVSRPKPATRHDRLVRRERASALADFKAAKTRAERRAVIRWYLSNKNGPFIPAVV